MNVTQLAEVHGLNPIVGKIYIEHLFTVNCIEKKKLKKTIPGMAHFKKLYHIFGLGYQTLT